MPSSTCSLAVHRRRFALALLLGALIGLAACARERTVMLTNDTNTLSLTYACEAEGVRALDTATVELVRTVILHEGAERIIGRGETSDEARAVRRAFESGQLGAIENAVALYACAHGNPGARPPRFPERGSEAPDFVLRTLGENGEPTADSVRLSHLRDRPVLLVFWGSWCGPCRDEYPTLVSLAQEFIPRGLALYVIGYSEPSRQTASWIRANGGMQVPFLVDSDGEAARGLKVHEVPRMFLLDTNGRVLNGGFGAMRPDSLRARLDRLLPG